jgi:hypothetical protein
VGGAARAAPGLPLPATATSAKAARARERLWLEPERRGEGIETEEEGGGRSGLGEVGATWRSQVGLCRGTGRWRRTLRAAKPAAP